MITLLLRIWAVTTATTAGYGSADRAGEELFARTLAASLETPHARKMISQLVGNREVLAEIEAGSAAVGKRLSAVRNERAGLVARPG